MTDQLIAEWEQALKFAGKRNIRLKAYAAKRLAELKANTATVEHSFVRRLNDHKAYNYTVDRHAEVKRVRDAAKDKAGYFPRRNWEKGEEQFLFDNFKSMSILEMSLHLKRPYESVAHKANRLGLLKNRKWLGSHAQS